LHPPSDPIGKLIQLRTICLYNESLLHHTRSTGFSHLDCAYQTVLISPDALNASVL
jgi:hypothetical protein